MVGRMMNRAAVKADPEPKVERGFFKARITLIVPEQEKCYAKLVSPYQGISRAILKVEQSESVRHLLNKGGGLFKRGERITILKMSKSDDIFTALEIA